MPARFAGEFPEGPLMLRAGPESFDSAQDDRGVFYTGLMADLGKLLLFFGVILAVVGLGLILLGRTNLPLGRLPGDFLVRGKNSTFYFPLATSILLSVVLSGVLYLIARFRK